VKEDYIERLKYSPGRQWLLQSLRHQRREMRRMGEELTDMQNGRREKQTNESSRVLERQFQRNYTIVIRKRNQHQTTYRKITVCSCLRRPTGGREGRTREGNQDLL
jgi:hypothetical protein